MTNKHIHLALTLSVLGAVSLGVLSRGNLQGATVNDCVGKPYGTTGCPTKASSSSFHPITCGNAVVDAQEECDLGTARNGFSNCTKDCRLLYCGDHLISPGLKEECEPEYQEVYAADPVTGELIIDVRYTAQSCGMICTVPECDEDGVCSSGCKRMFLPACPVGSASSANAQETSTTTAHAPLCGNGKVDGGEQCDDGNLITFDTCTNDCRVAICGDGLMQIWEQCDDGNRIDSDACSNTCKSPACGDGVTQPSEECDDGNQVNTDICTTACKIARCGDRIVQQQEDCDDGNQINTDTCTSVCRAPRCGDGVTQTGEECDDANTIETDACTSKCALSRCGDMIIQQSEECDDGNKIATDNCSNQCTLPFCGNGMREGQEVCDDGNQSNLDSCTQTCQKAICGDGFMQSGEFCDDGNQSDDDNCTVTCRIPTCGDALLHPSEQCDDGRKNSDTKADSCRMNCRESHCGDGVKDSGEECDGGENCAPECKLLKGAAPAASSGPWKGILWMSLAFFGVSAVLAYIFRKNLHTLIAKTAGEQIARSIDDIPLDQIETPWQKWK